MTDLAYLRKLWLEAQARKDLEDVDHGAGTMEPPWSSLEDRNWEHPKQRMTEEEELRNRFKRDHR